MGGGGPPVLRLAGAAAARADELGATVDVSLTHTHGMAGAVAMPPMSLPRWLEPLLDAEQMRETDAWAIETRGVPSLDLMERAGEGLARDRRRSTPAGRVAVVCGKGNNGGDGLVAARLLRQAGRDVDVLLVWPGQWLEGDAAEMLKRLPGPAAGGRSTPARLDAAHVIVDAVLGTGVTGRAAQAGRRGDRRDQRREGAGGRRRRPERRRRLDRRGRGRRRPGGGDRDVPPRQARAVDLARARRYAGDVHVIDIGIPRGGAGARPDTGLIGGGVLRDLPRRGSDSTKFSSGNVFILGGSRGLTGAPSMSALAAMRAGAGYVTVGAPASLELSFTVRLLEAMMVGLPETDGALSREAVGPALKAIGRADAVVLGPGPGARRDGARAFALEMFERIDVPLVIDADGLNALAGCFPEDLPQRRWPTVLTPHAGELGRLLGRRLRGGRAARGSSTREAAAAKARAFVVLKGDDTLVVSPTGRARSRAARRPGWRRPAPATCSRGSSARCSPRASPPAHAACAGSTRTSARARSRPPRTARTG